MSRQISVIVPAFNAENFIDRCLRSLLSQSLESEKYQIIVINDGSTDRTVEICKQYSSAIHLISTEKNQGLPSALNLGLQKANTRYFVRVDADDYVHSQFLELLLLKFLQDPTCMGVACDYKKVTPDEQLISVECALNNKIGCGVMFRAEILKVIGMYDERLFMAEEVEFMDRFLEQYRLDHLSIPLYRYVRHDKNMTNNEEKYQYFKSIAGSLK